MSHSEITDKEITKLLKMASEVVQPKKTSCPSCSKPLSINLLESLEAYSMTFKITPEKGRIVDALVVAEQIKNLKELLISVGKDYGHKTAVALLSVKTNKDMSVEIKVGTLPTIQIGEGK